MATVILWTGALAAAAAVLYLLAGHLLQALSRLAGDQKADELIAQNRYTYVEGMEKVDLEALDALGKANAAAHRAAERRRVKRQRKPLALVRRRTG